MYKSQMRALCDVQPRRDRRGSHERHDGHPVHVVGDGFGVGDGEASPALPGSGLEAFEEMEERDRGRGEFGWCRSRDFGKDCGQNQFEHQEEA